MDRRTVTGRALKGQSLPEVQSKKKYVCDYCGGGRWNCEVDITLIINYLRLHGEASSNNYNSVVTQHFTTILYITLVSLPHGKFMLILLQRWGGA